jgi:RNA polymerase sigma-70 factor (ECF subfamily)
MASPEPQVSRDEATEDRVLVQRALRGESAAVEQLVERLACVPGMVRALHRRKGGPLRSDELEDVEQAVIAALWGKLAQFEGRARLETWIFRFTQLEVHKALDRRRRARAEDIDRHEVPEARDEPAEPAVEPARLRDCIERVGPPASDILRMRHYEERTFDAIAAAMGESINTIKARYYRGLEKLRRLLEPHMGRQG